MAAGEIRINVSPGFGSLMQDLARHPLDETNARLGPAPATATPAAPASDPELAISRFVPTLLPLPSSNLHPPEADRRTRSLADVRKAFSSFDEPAADESPAERVAVSRATRVAPDDAQRPAATVTQRDAVLPGDVAAVAARSSAATQKRADDTSIRLRGAPAPASHAAIESLQASTTARAAPRKPASSQPVLLMIGCAIVSAALTWIVLRMVG